ncbi:MAG: DUF4434 domain-containing protein [Lentisphaeria bacterium]
MSCEPLVSGVTFNFGKSIFINSNYSYTINKEDWIQQFDSLQNIGCDLLFVIEGINQCMARTAVVDDDLLEFVFSECDKRNMEMIISTGHSSEWCNDYNVARETAFVSSSIEEIFRRYGSHPSFKGWYLPYELFIRRGKDINIISELFRSLVQLCKKKSPDLPVSISPFFMPDAPGNGKDFRNVEPSECVEFWSNLLSYSKIDILALQDNGGQHLSCFRNNDTKPFIDAFATACRNTKTRFWGNVEMGEFPVSSIADFKTRYGENGDVNDPHFSDDWRAVPIDQMARKLKLMSQFSERNISWGYNEFYRSTLAGVYKL